MASESVTGLLSVRLAEDLLNDIKAKFVELRVISDAVSASRNSVQENADFVGGQIEIAADAVALVQQIKDSVVELLDGGLITPQAQAAIDSINASLSLIQAHLNSAQEAATAASSDADLVHQDRLAIAADIETSTENRDATAADRAAVASDKTTVAADKATTAGYRDAAQAAAAAANSAMDDVDAALDAALASITAATSSAVGTVNSAGDAQVARLGGFANIVAYPVAAATNVPRGLLPGPVANGGSVGAVTPGSGYTNGTNYLAGWSGGNFAVNPVAMFDVVANQVTNFRIIVPQGASGSGEYIGAAPSVPTPTFGAAGAGTGAAVALTAQFLVANGGRYWAESADGLTMNSYQNVAGVATLRTDVGPIPTTTSIEASRRDRIKREVVAATGAYGKSAISCLLTADGVKTFKSGTTLGEIDFIQPLLPETGLGFGQNAVTYDGGVSSGAIHGSPYRRPVLAMQGDTPAIKFFNHQVGFTATDGTTATSGNRVPIFSPENLDINGSWGIDFIFSMPAIKNTYPSTAAALADGANLTVGDIIYISTGDPRPAAFNGSYDKVPADALGPLIGNDASFPDGYHVVGSQNNILPIGGRLLTFYDTANGTGKYSMLYFNKRGQLLWYNYDGTRQGTCQTLCYDIVKLGQTGRVHLHLEKTPVGGLLMTINGHDRSSQYNTASYFVGTPNRFQINGVGEAPGGYEKVPLNGNPFTMLALCISQGMDYTAMRHVSDALAKIYGTPKRHWDPIAYLITVFDQSRFSGTDDATTSPHPANVSGWSLQLRGKGGGSGLISADSMIRHPSQMNDMAADPWYGMYAPSTTLGTIDAMTPGPVGLAYNIAGSASAAAYTHTLNGTGAWESLEWGMTRELQRDPELRNHHFYFLGSTYGGYSLEQLAEEDLPIQELHTLRDPSAIVTKPRTIDYRALEVMVKFVKNRGQVLQPLALCNFQAETFSYVLAARGGVGTRRRKEMRDYYNNVIKVLCDTTSRPPIIVTKSGAVSGDGFGIGGWNNAPTWPDSERMDMENLRTPNDFRLIHLAGTANWFGPGIHWPAVYVRNGGAIAGDRIRREWCLNEKAGATKITNAVIGSGGNAGKLVLTVNRRLTLDVAGTDARYPGTYHLDGLNGTGPLTYGLIFESHAWGSVTFAGQPSSGDTVKVGSVTYTFVNTLTTGTQVVIGSTLAQTMANFVAAVNSSAEVDPSGIYTASGLLQNADAWAYQYSSSVVRIFANAAGTAGNAVALTKTGANITVSGATLAGADDTRTIGGDVTYSNGTNTATILVPISGAGPQVGDLIKVMGTGVRFSNFREEATRNGYYKYQTWPAFPLAAPGDVERDYSTDSIISDFLGPQKFFIQG